MTPFDWRGPQFLLFYAALAVVMLVAVRFARRRRESMDGGWRGTPIHDPYAIALLRGGKNELIRVAIVALVDRGLLWVRDEQVVTTEVGRSTSVRRRIEKDLLSFCAAPREAKDLFSTRELDTAVAELELELSRMGMLPDDDITAARRKLFGFGAGVLLFFSVGKIVVALSRGRTNLGFLILFTAIALLLLYRAALSGRTVRGDAFLKEMQNLFGSLKLRAGQLRPGGASSEVAMLAAVWGVGALSAETFGWSWTDKFFQKASSSSGSSCGSSCGSGCGGGCGGGGCGGCGG